MTNLRPRFITRRRASAAIAFLIAAAAGMFAVSASQAATFVAAPEAESGAITAPAAIVSAESASGGTAVTFQAAATGGGKMSGLRVSGSSIMNGRGQQAQMHGVNYSGFEYSCLDGIMNDGPVPPGIAQVNGMKSWNVNSVRLPLNEDCWLGIHGIPAANAGANYQKAVADFVNLLVANDISVIINLHFNGDVTRKAV